LESYVYFVKPSIYLYGLILNNIVSCKILLLRTIYLWTLKMWTHLK